MVGTLLRMVDQRLPKRIMSGELENAGKCWPTGKKEWTGCMAKGRWVFGITGDWSTDPGVWYSTVREGGCRFVAAWVREEEKASEHRQGKREAEETDKVEVAPGVTVASLRRFRAALIGPTQGLPKRRRLCLWVQMLLRDSCDRSGGGYRMVRSWRYTKLSIECPIFFWHMLCGIVFFFLSFSFSSSFHAFVGAL